MPSPSRTAAFVAPFLAAAAAAQSPVWQTAEDVPVDLTHLVYDAARGRVLGWGPPWATVASNAPWVLGPGGWRLQNPGLGAGSYVGAVFYDPVRAQTGVVVETLQLQRRTYFGDGAGWRLANQSVNTPYSGAGFAFDPSRNQVVAFGGNHPQSGIPSDTMWAWTGSQWQVLTPAVRPTPRSGGGMALDAARGRIVLFGGVDDQYQALGDTWEWDGSNWQSVASAVSPSARLGPLVFEPRLQRVVLVGGQPLQGGPRSDCWSWTGSTWQPYATLPASPGAFRTYSDGADLYVVDSYTANVLRRQGSGWGPAYTANQPPRTALILGYDPVRAELVGVGGDTTTTTTWAWNGSWQQRATGGPSPRGGCSLVPLGNEMLLFGGMQAPLQIIADNWLWNGTSWRTVVTNTLPPARWQYGMASLGSRVVLFGGRGGVLLDDTWEFDGVDWTQRQTAHAPSARERLGMAYDRARQRVVLYGGADSSNFFTDTWEFDGVDWTQRQASFPAFGGETSLVYDTAAAAVARVEGDRYLRWNGTNWTGGYTGTSNTTGFTLAYHEARQRAVRSIYTGMTEILGPTPATVDYTGVGCGQNPSLHLLGRPGVGLTPEVQVNMLPQAVAFVGYGLQPANVAWPGGCVQQVAVLATAAVAGDTLGFATLPLALPPTLSLRGVAVLVQAVALDGGPLLGASLSVPLRIQVGD